MPQLNNFFLVNVQLQFDAIVQTCRTPKTITLSPSFTCITHLWSEACFHEFQFPKAPFTRDDCNAHRQKDHENNRHTLI